MTLKHLGIIGAGNIATGLLDVLNHQLPVRLERITVLARPGRSEPARELAHIAGRATLDFIVVDDFAAFLDLRPDLVIECAGHDALRDFAEPLLQAGIETVAVSTGALADDVLRERLDHAARKGGTRLVLPAGAVGGMDILAAIRHAQIHSVTYVARKPPRAWAGTKAEKLIDLDSIAGETVFFDGPARQAALDCPRNANVAATISLAGIGFEDTQVRLIADPSVSANIHSFEVVSDAAEVTVRIKGKPSSRNSKTSLPTVYSLVREVMRRVQPIVS